MSIPINKFGTTPKFNKDEYLKKFIPLVIDNASEFDNFSVFDLHKSLNLSENELKIFKQLTFDIRKHLIDNGIAKMYGSRKITLTEKGRDIKNGTEKIFGTIINNDFSNSTIGTVIQESDLKKARIKSNQKKRKQYTIKEASNSKTII